MQGDVFSPDDLREVTADADEVPATVLRDEDRPVAFDDDRWDEAA